MKRKLLLLFVTLLLPLAGIAKIIESQSGDPGYSISINSSNFPDEKFREYVSGTSIDKDGSGSLDDEEIDAVTTIDVNNLAISDMKGIEFFTSLTTLNCRFTKITSLDLSNNIALKDLDCRNNNLTSLNVSNNTALTSLKCSRNKITSLDVSRNTQLTLLRCNYNKLTELDVSENTKLTRLDCYGNNIGLEKMGILVGSLPTVAGGKGQFYVIDTTLGDEANVCTSALVEAAKAKGWKVYNYNNGTSIEYAGSSAEPEPYVVLSSNGQTVTFYYDDQKATRGGIDINNSSIEYGESSPYGTATTAVFDASFADYRPVSTAYWFMYCNSLTTITGLENLKTDNVTNMRYMFLDCSNLKSLNVSGFNTSNVTDMMGMFVGCSGLTSLDVSGFDTSNVILMDAMFSNCSGLTSLDLSGFDTSNVTEMASMFMRCSSLTSLDLNCLNTSNVFSMAWMFDGCSGLTNLDLSGFDTSNVTNMEWMFEDCSSLTSLDLSSFDTSNVGNMMSMFDGCSSLITIYAEETKWSTESMTWHPTMFRNCISLVGGYGTVYDPNNINSYYACIDKPEQPGYLTQKGEISDGIAINKTSFPDTHFRSWVLAQTYGADGILTDEEIASVTEITGITDVEDFKGLELFTALRKFFCNWGHIRWDGQDATPVSLDLSKNTALEYLSCDGYTIVSLDVSKNTELTYLSCGWNKLTSLNLSNNKKLTELHCWNNQLTELDLSNNTALTTLSCSSNYLTSLIVSKNDNLRDLNCSLNNIHDNQMDALIESLPVTTNGKFIVINTSNENEGNVCTKTQVAAAKAKGWTVLANDGSNLVEYEGSEEGGGDGITINETNFPDENFRNWVLAQDYGADGVLTQEEIARVTRIDVSSKSISNLKGIEHFTSLTILNCAENKLTTLDVSKNKALEDLDCGGNQLKELDVYYNINLTSLGCWGNQLKELDISHNKNLVNLLCFSNLLSNLKIWENTALEYIDCTNNQLTILYVSGCLALKELYCGYNKLEELYLSDNNELTKLYCERNYINSTEMNNVVENLPTVTEGTFGAFYQGSSFEANVITATQVAAARAKGWTVLAYDGSNWLDYEGSVAIGPIEEETTVDLGESLADEESLEDTVVDNVYYNLGENDGYDSADGCVVINTTTDMTGITEGKPGSEDVKENFNGMIIEVDGKGVINLDCQTTGSMKVCVQVGENEPTMATMGGRGTLEVGYNVIEPTYVYIYATTNTAAPNFVSSATNSLKIWSLTVKPEAETSIGAMLSDGREMKYYTLDGRKLQGKPTQKGLYVVNGRKVVVK